MSLWKKNLYWLVVIQVLAGSAIIGVISFIPLFIHELGIHDVGAAGMWAGLITGVTSLTAALANPYWGAYGDRRGRKRVIIQILLALTVVMGVMSLVQSPLQLFVLRAVQGAVGGFIAAGLAMVVTQTPKEHSSSALGIYQTGIVLGATLGPVLGGAVADLVGYRETFVFFGMLALIGAGVAYRFLYEDFTPVPQTEKDSVLDNFKLFMRIPTVRLMMGIQFLVNFALMGLGPILPIYIKGMVGDTGALASISGIILAIGGLAGALSSLNMRRICQWFTHRNILMYGSFFAGLFFIAQYFAHDIYTLGFFRMLNGFCIGTLMPSANTIIAANVPENKRGVAFGVTSSATLMGNVIGPIVSGILALSLGMASVFWSTALFLLCISFIVAKRLPEDAAVAHIQKWK